MKKTLLITLVFICFLRICYSQTNIYHSLPVSNALWRESSGDYPCNCCREYQYTISGDTLINGTSYHKLNWMGTVYSNSDPQYVSLSYWGCNGPDFYYLNSNSASVYAGSFRENVSTKKVYFIEPGSLNDTLLYDFNLNIGDTLPDSYTNSNEVFSNYIISIDSVLVSGVYHKKFNIATGSDPAYVSIIEGIGSTFGFLGRLIPVFESGSILNCFITNGVQAYTTVGAFCQPITLDLKENDPAGAFFIQPTVSDGNYKLILEKRSDLNMDIKNVLGESILKMKIRDQTTNINLAGQPEGIYFLSVVDEKGRRSVKKLIKQ